MTESWWACAQGRWRPRRRARSRTPAGASAREGEEPRLAHTRPHARPRLRRVHHPGGHADTLVDAIDRWSAGRRKALRVLGRAAEASVAAACEAEERIFGGGRVPDEASCDMLARRIARGACRMGGPDLAIYDASSRGGVRMAAAGGSPRGSSPQAGVLAHHGVLQEGEEDPERSSTRGVPRMRAESLEARLLRRWRCRSPRIRRLRMGPDIRPEGFGGRGCRSLPEPM